MPHGRATAIEGDYEWDDGTPLVFTNWGVPRDTASSASYVSMALDDDVAGRWDGRASSTAGGLCLCMRRRGEHGSICTMMHANISINGHGAFVCDEWSETTITLLGSLGGSRDSGAFLVPLVELLLWWAYAGSDARQQPRGSTLQQLPTQTPLRQPPTQTPRPATAPISAVAVCRLTVLGKGASKPPSSFSLACRNASNSKLVDAERVRVVLGRQLYSSDADTGGIEGAFISLYSDGAGSS